MADALSELSHGHGQPDPDAQATLHDFLDYTEFFPSDLVRSLTLIGKLDEEYQEHADKVHVLTKVYGSLPGQADPEGRAPRTLRHEISSNLDQALKRRAASHAEASRLAGVTENLYNRLENIRKKLVAMPKPPSREPSPAPKQPRSPNATRTRKGDTQKLKQGVQDTPTRNATAAAREKKRSRRIIVPGEVLPPVDPNSPLGSESSDSESDGAIDRILAARADRRKTPGSPVRNIIRLSNNAPIIKTPKVRPHGVLGTNAHSQVAGISVSNAMAVLTPPPEDPQPGSEWAPWFALTEWELNALRKKMKKNAHWKPSDTMTRKTLMENGRGRENYELAKKRAEETGLPFLDEPPHRFSAKTEGPKILPISAQIAADDEDGDPHMNRGMRLNQQKKLKREAQKLEEAIAAGDIQSVQSIQSAQSAQSSADYDFMRFLTDQGKKHSELFNATHSGVLSPSTTKLSSPGDEPRSGRARKRKRDSDDDAQFGSEDELGSPGGMASKFKLYASRDELETIGEDEEGNPITIKTTTTQIPLAPEGAGASTTAESAAGPKLSLRMGSLTAASRRPTRGNRSQSLQAGSPSPTTQTRGGQSDRATSITLRLSQKAASAEPPPQRSSKRRVSETALLQDPPPSTGPSRRGKRTAPGMTIQGTEGGPKLSLTRRKNAPTGQGSSSADRLDPGEELYCLCNGPSFGTMVACENENNCSREWFHLECVGLNKPPTKNQKWWCPDCRQALGIGQFGENQRRMRSK